MSENDSSTVVGPAAIIEGRAAFILSRLLARSMRRGLSVRQIVAEARLSPADQAAVLCAERELEKAGQRWAEIRESAKAGESGEPLASEVMSTRAAATLIGRTPQRVTQLIRQGVLSAIMTPRGYALDRHEVLEYAQGLPEASVAGVTDSTPPAVIPIRDDDDGRSGGSPSTVVSSLVAEART
jgi:hypothetical protein